MADILWSGRDLRAVHSHILRRRIQRSRTSGRSLESLIRSRALHMSHPHTMYHGSGQTSRGEWRNMGRRWRA